MHYDEDHLPSPEELAREAEETPRKVNIRDYYRTVLILREKRFSFGDIAEWLSKRLGVEVTRSQISYLLTTPPDVLAEEEEQAEIEAREEAEEEAGR